MESLERQVDSAKMKFYGLFLILLSFILVHMSV